MTPLVPLVLAALAHPGGAAPRQVDLRLLARLRPLIQACDRHIADLAATIPEAQWLRTIPGIGPHRALVIGAEVLPIARFRTPNHLASYAGLVPCSKQSGQGPVRHGAIPAGANRCLRGALVRAVVSHVQYAHSRDVAHAQHVAERSASG